MPEKPKWPIGVFKWIKATDHPDPTAQHRFIDLKYFVEIPHLMAFRCLLNGKLYPREMFADYASQEQGRVWVMTDEAKSLLL